MRKTSLCLAAALGCAASLMANTDTIAVNNLRLSASHIVRLPHMVDSLDVNSKPYDAASLLQSTAAPSAAMMTGASDFTGGALPVTDSPAVYTLQFSIDNDRYASASLLIKGLESWQAWIDGDKVEGGKLRLTPATHTVAIKCLSQGTDSITVALVSEQAANINIAGEKFGRRYTLRDVMEARRYAGISLSPSGKYLLTNYSKAQKGGKTDYTQQLTEARTGKALPLPQQAMAAWMPSSDRIWYVREVSGVRNLYIYDPATSVETLLVSGVPEGRLAISPTEDFAVYHMRQEGPKEKFPDVYEIIHPEDRQPGWRDRNSLAIIDFATGICEPLTYGHKDTHLHDISIDGTKLLFSVQSYNLEQRPTTLSSFYIMDIATRQATPVLENDGFAGRALLSPDATKVLVQASAEGLDGSGLNLPAGLTPNMTEQQLFIIEVASGAITPLTREFDPSVASFEWNPYDGNIYLTAENGDRVDLYCANPSTGKIESLNAAEELVSSIATAAKAPLLAYWGQGVSNSDRLYLMDLKKHTSTLLEDLSAQTLEGVTLGDVDSFSFTTADGNQVLCRYILPPDFDLTKQYPLIVNYYGGCSPTSRYFESRYPHHLYAAHGYVVLVVNPRGASGFGQEHGAAHVNTAGNGPAQDIIEAVKHFTADHPFINKDKIGCIGASYGGFMSQWLQTQTDIFACAISHAGISDHTSYWGEGYWGYSYSEVSMANSYPWSHRKLYVDQSPLFNADKIHTPLLFLHGDADTNVPVGESIQMYTALKLLGRPTAFVAVKGADHHVLDYAQRTKWQETIFAWFARYLQDDASWWNDLYPEKAL